VRVDVTVVPACGGSCLLIRAMHVCCAAYVKAMRRCPSRELCGVWHPLTPPSTVVLMTCQNKTQKKNGNINLKRIEAS
jgi:hypothetical protein